MADGKLFVIVGKSRSGKTYWTLQQLAKYARVIVWDIKGDPKEFKGFTRCSSRTELAKLLGQHQKAPLKVAYHVNRNSDIKSEFDWWCNMAFDWAEDKPCAIVAEELADVTTPQKAPRGWGMLLRKVLCTGSDVYAITQRPMESDKTAMGNATVLHCHMMKRLNDKKYLANELGVEYAEMNALRQYDYIESWDTGDIKRYTHK